VTAAQGSLPRQCQARRPRPRQARTTRALRATPWQRAPQEPTAEDRRFLEEWSRAHDPALLYGIRPQRASAHFRPIAAQGPFPFAQIARVRAYSYRWGSFEDADFAFQCSERVLRKDGTLCPSASFPGKMLSDAQRDELVTALRKPPVPGDPMIHARCIFNPHHAFVFFDADDAPVAELDVCFSCGQVSSWPYKPPGLDTRAMWNAVGSLCRDLALSVCSPDFFFDRARANEALGRAMTPVVHRGIADELGVDPQTLESKLGPEARRLLCRWSNHVGRLWDGRRLVQDDEDGAFGLRFDVGMDLVFMGMDQCLATFPRCEVPAEAVERCFDKRFPKAEYDQADPNVPSTATYPATVPYPPPPECDAVRKCVWGVEEKKSPGASGADGGGP
jgi:hypothetical protein